MRDFILRILMLSCLIFVLPESWAAGDSAADVPGWQDTRWGMSPDELKKLYGDKITAKSQDNGKEILTLAKYELFGTDFDVSFFWKDGVKLSRVVVGIFKPETDLSHVASKLVSSLRFKYGEGKILEQKYTEPSFLTIGNSTTNVLGSNTMKIRWLFPSTLITYSHQLIMLGPAQPGASIISVTYEPNEAGKL